MPEDVRSMEGLGHARAEVGVGRSLGMRPSVQQGLATAKRDMDERANAAHDAATAGVARERTANATAEADDARGNRRSRLAAPARACNDKLGASEQGPNVRHERRRKGREAAFGTSARGRG